MSIFAHNVGLCMSIFPAPFNPLNRRIHRGINFCISIAALPMCDARRIKRLHLLESFLKANAVASLVAHGPHRHRRMVAEEKNITKIALDNRMLPLLKATKAFLAVAVFMPLHICLSNNINAVAVTKIVPKMMIGIVASTNRVDIV